MDFLVLLFPLVFLRCDLRRLRDHGGEVIILYSATIIMGRSGRSKVEH
jgi:uncharacterized membrane protein